MSRVNIWIVIAILLVLFAVTRYVMHERKISHICVNDPSAPECQRWGPLPYDRKTPLTALQRGDDRARLERAWCPIRWHVATPK